MKFSVVSLGLFVALSLASGAVADETTAAAQSPENEARPTNLRGATADRKLPGLFDDDNDRRTYILSFKGKSDDAPGNGPGARCDALAKAHGGTTGFVYDRVLNGCSMRLPPAAARALQKNPQIARLEEDQVVVKSQTETINNPQSWGLDRIDQENLPLDQVYEKVSAAGVRVYILDTGLNGNHDDFGGGMLGPASCHVSEVGEVALNDGDGHGTHVGSTTCGLTYGVASNCELCAVQVLDSTGSGSWAGVIAGINHAVNNCNVDNTGNGKCVLNMSLGGGQSDSINEAVANAVTAGVVAVVAAGNENTDACTKSPASELSAITVGSTTRFDGRSSFSNYGSCVDVYAPGSDITAAWIPNTDSVATIGGTSMASPHVAGIAAAFLSAEPNLTPAQVSERITASATNSCTSCDHGLANTLGVGNPNFTFSPTPGPTPTPPCYEMEMEVTLTTDDYPSETSWTFTDQCGTGQVYPGPSYSPTGTTTTTSMCLPTARYTFTIIDSFGDGICCSYGPGSYTVTHGGNQVGSGGDFGSSASHTFGNCDAGPSPTPPPTNASTPPPSPTPTPNPTPNPTTPLPTTPNPTTAQPTTPPPTTAQPTTAQPTTPPPTTAQPTPNPTPNPTTSSPTTPSPTPPPTTAQPTPNPTPNPTTPQPTPCSGMEIKVDILTDNYPAETSWTLTNNCDSSVTNSPSYPSGETSYSDTYCLPSAEYTFTLLDSYGDGICCGYGSGNYAVYSDGTEVASGGQFGSSESTTFGSCPAVPSPTPPPTAPVTPPPTPPAAVFDTSLGVPKCSTVGSSCTSGPLLNGFKNQQEPNPSNTLDSCEDGSYGTYHEDESVDKITVTAVGGVQLEAGATVQIDAQVWAFGTGSSDTADFYYTSDVGPFPTWTFIGSVVPGGGGQQTLSVQYTLPDSALQAVRVHFRYGGEQSPCAADPAGWYDVDDLSFAVAPASVAVAGVGKKPARVAPPKPLQSSHCADIDVSERKRCEAVSVCEWHNGKDKGCYPKA